MKNRLKIHSIIVLVVMFIFTSCVVSACGILGESGSEGTDPIGGELSAMGEPGNTFDIPGFSGTSERNAEVISRDGDISKIRASAKATNQNLLNIAQGLEAEGLEISGDRVSFDLNVRMTSKGIQNVSSDKSKTLSLVEYDAKVGDTYKGKNSFGEVKRSVTKVSTEDDFMWGFMYIKTIQVEERNQIPGINKVVYYANHRFGLVAADIFYEDGSKTMTYVYSNYQ